MKFKILIQLNRYMLIIFYNLYLKYGIGKNGLSS